MPYGPSCRSITSEAPRRFDRLEFGKIEFDNCPQNLSHGAFLLIVGQRVQPGAILLLEFRERGDRIVPSLDLGAPVGGAACADNWWAGHARGAIACLSFGTGHWCFTDQRARHGSAPWRY